MLTVSVYGLTQAQYHFSGHKGPAIWTKFACPEGIISNALEFIDWLGDGSDEVELVLCDACGNPGCNSGNLVRIRQTGDRIFLLPSKRDPDWDHPLVQNHNCVVIIDKIWNKISGSIPSLPAASAFPPFTSRDALEVWISNLPIQASNGEQVDGSISPRNMLAAYPDELGPVLEVLLTIPAEWQRDDAPCSVRPLCDSDVLQTIYLDAQGLNSHGFPYAEQRTIDWQPLVRTQDGYALFLEPDLVAAKIHRGSNCDN